LRELMRKLAGSGAILFFARFFLRELMKKVGGIWSHIICGQILYQPLNIYFFKVVIILGETVVRGPDHGTFIFLRS
jgi:hypothetical protein